MNGKNRVYKSGRKHNSLEVTFSISKVHDGKGCKRNPFDFAEASNRYKLGGLAIKAHKKLKKQLLDKGNAMELGKKV